MLLNTTSQGRKQAMISFDTKVLLCRTEQQASAGSKTAARQPNRPALTENRRY